MALKFIEYLRIDEVVVSAYIVQEPFTQGDNICFQVQIHGEKRFDFFLCKQINKDWTIITQAFPDFVLKNLFDSVTAIIDKRLTEKAGFLILT